MNLELQALNFKRSTILYGIAIALGAILMQWLEFQYTVRFFSSDVYIILIAVLFTVLGLWVGNRLSSPKQKEEEFKRNEEALTYLGISEREYEVLTLLADGKSNKEIADSLFVSTNTIKTHLKNLFSKLEVSRRTQAVQKARELRLIP